MPNSYEIHCADPDHTKRKGEPGWAEVLGTTTAPGKLGASYCAACRPQPAEPEPPAPPAEPDLVHLPA